MPCLEVPQGVLLTKGKKLTKMDLTQEEIPTSFHQISNQVIFLLITHS
jgi:hypothetical protein